MEEVRDLWEDRVASSKSLGKKVFLVFLIKGVVLGCVAYIQFMTQYGGPGSHKSGEISNVLGSLYRTIFIFSPLESLAVGAGYGFIIYFIMLEWFKANLRLKYPHAIYAKDEFGDWSWQSVEEYRGTPQNPSNYSDP